jgi:hypothetical protein
LSGCTTYSIIKMESNFVAAAQAQSQPDIIATDDYRRLNKTNLAVAVKAPDQCTSYTTDQRTGQAAAGETILKTDCGLEMGEIERALARTGYRVISWTAFNQQIETGKNIIKAAQELGADVVFQINSLENSIKSLGQDARWERAYYRSDWMGNTVAPMDLGSTTRNDFATRFLVPLESQYNTRTYNVTIDAVAISVMNGQSIWYYRWAKASDLGQQENRFVAYVQCDNALPYEYCSRYTPPRTQQADTNRAAGDTIGVSQGERPEDIAKAMYAELYNEVVSNLVSSFAQR